MATVLGRQSPIYKFDSTLGDTPRSASLIDHVDYQKGILHLRGIQGGNGITVTVLDADDNVFSTIERKISISLDGSVGDISNMASLGTVADGAELIGNKVDGVLYFKRIRGGSGINVLDHGSYLEVSSVANGAGEANDGLNNVLGAGIGVYDHKEGANLIFRKITSGGSIQVSLDSNSNVNLELDTSTVTLNSFSGTVAATSVTGLANVATSGSYADLQGKPALFDGNYNNLYNRPVLFSGNYNELYNRPVVLSQEQVEDVVGAMVTGNTETNITVEYDQTNRKLNFSGGLALSGDPIPTLGGNLNVATYSIVGDTIRLTTIDPNGVVNINGVEFSGRKLSTIHDAQAAPQTFYSATASAYEAIILDYIITRGTDTRMGSLSIINNGYTAVFSDAGPEIGSVGVDFVTNLVGSIIEVGYTTTATGVDGEISYTVRRWDAN